MSRDVQGSFAATLVDEFARRGVRHAFVSPGSRNTPLSLALAADPRVAVHVVLDERSAAFAALGAGRAAGRPALVCCTSGTATANHHPAVVEAHHGAVPLVLCSADRPARLRGTGANQTIDQTTLYGSALRAFVDAGTDADARAIAARAVAWATGSPPGPVQCNLQFDEPLVPTGPVEVPDSDRTRAVAAEPPATTRVEVPTARRPVILAGWDAGAVHLPVGVPVLADPLSGLRAGDDAVSAYEALLRVPGFVDAHRPDLVIRLGMPLTGKATHPWCDGSIPQVLVTRDSRPADPFRSADRVVAPPGALRVDPATPEPAWTAAWREAEAAARVAIDRALDSFATPFDGRVLRDLASALPDDATLFVGNSMPVRDLEYFMAPRLGLQVVANRGASGIDGCVSTIVGLALEARRDQPTVGVIGDLAFLHDTNGLLAARETGVAAVVVVLDNDGGGIFEFLPQREAVPDRFERLFATPHGLDLVAVAAAHGVAATRVSSVEVVDALDAARAAGGPQVIVVPSDRVENRERHRAVWDAVAAALT